MKSHKHAILQYEEDRNPGCMWGILQSLRFYRWHMLKIRKQSPSKVSRLARLNMKDSMKEVEPLVAKADESLAELRPTKAASAKRKSRQTRIRALIAEEIKQESNENMQVSDAQLKHSSSIYPLKEPNHCLGKINGGWDQTDPPPCHNKQNVCGSFDFVDLFGVNELNEPYEHIPEKSKKARNLEIQRHKEANQLGNNLSHPQYRECTNVVDILKVSSELFPKLIQVPEDHSTETDKKMRLRRSGSYPSVKPSSTRIVVSCNLEHKQKEVWATRSMQLTADDKIAFCRSQSMGVSSICSPYQSFHLGQIQNQLEDDKQNLKHALKTNRRERNRITMEALHWNPHVPGLSADDKVNKAGSEVKDRQNHFKRASSLNELMDRYAQLLDHSFSKDYILPKSKSLRLTNEDEFGCGRSAPKSFRKNLSLHNLESYHSLQNEVCTEAHDSGLLGITSVDKFKYMASDRKDGFRPKVSHDLRADMIEPEVQDGISGRGQMVGSTEITGTGPGKKFLRTTLCDGDLAKPPELALPEGLEFKPRCCDLEGLDSYVNPERTSMETITSEASISLVNPENVGDTDSKNEVAEHMYEKETSGTKFPKNMWYTPPGQPLDPSALEEVQAYLLRESSAGLSKEPGEGSCDSKVQSDLDNEAVLKMFERLSVYWPRPLSSSCHIPPMPTWSHILEEVRVSSTRRRAQRPPRPELWGQWLESAVSRDMTRDVNDWMNLQSESENVVLELEDLIFYELLLDLEDSLCS